MLDEHSTTRSDIKSDSLYNSGSHLICKAQLSLGGGGVVLDLTLVGKLLSRGSFGQSFIFQIRISLPWV